jgi:hypothetical protein
MTGPVSEGHGPTNRQLDAGNTTLGELGAA